jgi:hypothetical protein
MKPPLPPWAGNDAAHRRTNQRISLLPAEYPTASHPGKFHLIGKNNFPINNADAGPMLAFGGMQGTGLFMRRISRWRLSFDAVARNCRSNGLNVLTDPLKKGAGPHCGATAVPGSIGFSPGTMIQ